MKPFYIVVAIDLNSGIGKNGALPWHLPADMKHFKELTTTAQSNSKKNAVIMGRKTWESLSEKFRPLPQRLNVILTRNKAYSLPDGVLKAASLDEALTFFSHVEFKDAIENVYVIGGGEVFKEALKNPNCQKIYLTQVHAKFDCDVFFPEFKKDFKQVLTSSSLTENLVEYHFAVFNRV